MNFKRRIHQVPEQKTPPNSNRMKGLFIKIRSLLIYPRLLKTKIKKRINIIHHERNEQNIKHILFMNYTHLFFLDMDKLIVVFV